MVSMLYEMTIRTSSLKSDWIATQSLSNAKSRLLGVRSDTLSMVNVTRVVGKLDQEEIYATRKAITTPSTSKGNDTPNITGATSLR